MDTLIRENLITAELKALGIQEINSGVSSGLNWLKGEGNVIESYSPVDGELIARCTGASRDEYEIILNTSLEAFKEWRLWPAPKRGEVVRQIGEKLRLHKNDLGKLVSYEMGKSLQEGLGEVQEMIDICDFAVGLSRQLYGLTMHSERPLHRMYEQWHPLGVVGIITAFNFPVAVWSWNAALAFVCGDVCIWKPSSKVPLSAIATQKLIADVLKENNVPEGVSCLMVSHSAIGEELAKDKRVPLISVTGSTRVGKKIGAIVGERLGRVIQELGGNNGIIISENANMDIAMRASVFGAVGTCGQRCTTTRRLIIHESIYDDFIKKLIKAYSQLRIGNPLDENNHVGPLIDKGAVNDYLNAINKAVEEGGKILVEGGVVQGEGYESECYVKPCIIEAKNEFAIVQHETFAPILYVMKYSDLDEAIEMHNNVPQGLSSAIMSTNLLEVEKFLSAAGSDCGIANANIGTSGAEIGGAFGGEKETGGGRESGSDAWKAYMRRQTNTINYSTKLPLAQGIKFDIAP
ncbi:MAG: aldehyde dehydrogenase family protein [Fimbriimonadaceae bacterium]|nr:aldehyde dehydrogenase family protein [Chitinophagales bacterium]